jgi:hypothetical protein
MDLKTVIESSTEALTEQVEKVAASISPTLASLAETPLGQQIASIVSSAAEKAEEALSSGEEQSAHEIPAPPEPRPAPRVEAPPPADAPASLPVPSGDATTDLAAADDSGSGSRTVLVIGGSVLVAGAVAAAAAVVYRRRRSGQEADQGQAQDSEGAVVTPISPLASGAAADSATADPAEEEGESAGAAVIGGEGYVRELDEEAEHFAQDFVDHVDDEDEEEILDPDFTVEVDVEADHFAQELVDRIEVTDDDLKAEEELEKQA